MKPKGAFTSERAAERNRRQRQHGYRLRERARLHQRSERRRVQAKLADAWERCSQQVASSQRRGFLAKAKCLLASAESRQAARRSWERSQRMAREARARAESRRS